jgi:RHS repeat-associated protein
MQERYFSQTNLLLIVVSVVTMLCDSVFVHAQEKRSPDKGFQTVGSYALSDIETVNLTNGNMLLRIPLASLPAGRGGNPGYTVSLIYNSKLWDAKGEARSDGTSIEGRPTTYTANKLMPSADGGWSYGYRYRLRLVSRKNLEPDPPCTCTADVHKNAYIWKLQMVFPDGSVHEFAPRDYEDYFHDGYYKIDANGWMQSSSASFGYQGDPPGPPNPPPGDCTCHSGRGSVVTNGMTYISTDGTFMRLVVEHVNGDVNGSGNPWTLYYPDGRKVMSNGTGYTAGQTEVQRVYDRNDNYVEINGGTVTDELGRSITVGSSGVTIKGVGGEPLQTTVTWKDVWVARDYFLSDDPNALTKKDHIFYPIPVVDKITLPAQAGGLAYDFGYAASAERPSPGNQTNGWGELNSITLPSGARADYKYLKDVISPMRLTAFEVLHNYPTEKKLTYLSEYDGISTPMEEVWAYEVTSTTGAVTTPVGGTTTDYFKTTYDAVAWDSGLAYKTVSPHIVIERVWQQNNPHIPYGASANPYVKTEFTSLTDAGGNPLKTAIKDYTYDQNGNVTRVEEYDWVAYSLVPHDATGRVTELTPTLKQNIQQYLKRVTVNEYYNPTPEASDTTSSADAYPFPTGEARRLLSPPKVSEIRDGGGHVLARTEYEYDDYNLKGNLTRQASWDSTKGGYSAPLSANNAISVSHRYDVYGNLILTTDARGAQTQFTYGAIDGTTATLTDLYPTQTSIALNTPVQRTSRQEYDFYSGLVTKSTDADNNVSTTTSYDVFGRPLLMKAAVSTPAETHTAIEYSDVHRRVITRSDLDTLGDGQLVSIRHYDQLGRLRLSRQLEDATTESATDETAGIKVQTRYSVDSVNHFSYQLVSNPYRAATAAEAGGEATMGWSRSQADHTGRLVHVQTFAGATLPAPWGGNSHSTGAVLTSYDADSTTVTDQAQKTRHSTVDALGRLREVREAPDRQDYNYLTSYQYDALNNLTTVVQGEQGRGTIQTRSFVYDSLSRLTSATNPESDTLSYEYDASGNLKKKTDARQISTIYQYDELSRLKRRTYSDSTPPVSYTYDDPTVTYSRGRLTSVSSSVSTSHYTGYDALGRVTASAQTTDAQTYSLRYAYDLSGHLTRQTYPSGRIVVTDYDAAGRLSGVKQQATGFYYAGSAPTATMGRMQYAAHGGLSAMRLGNQMWEMTRFNNRLQPTEISLGTQRDDSSVLRLDYGYGAAGKNNGNVRSQTITAPGLTLSQTYDYDALNRLESAREMSGATENWKQQYLYDRFGNRTIDTNPAYTTPELVGANPIVSPANNRITPRPGESYHYDSAGNLDRDQTNNAYTYDAENHLVSYNGGAGVNGGTSYSYDGEGRRVKQVTPSGVTVFVYNVLGQLVAEYSSEPPVSRGTSYLTADTLGSTRVVTSQQQEVRERRDYLPFGEELTRGGRSNVRGYSQHVSRQQFTGYERDTETGWDFAQARFYASAQGRFTSADPLMASARANSPQTWNRYVYCGNNPLSRVDPSGLDWWYQTGQKQNVPEWHDRDPGKGYERWTNNSSFVYQSGTSGKWWALHPYSGEAHAFGTASEALDAFSGYFGATPGGDTPYNIPLPTLGEMEFAAGVSTGVSPVGFLFPSFYESQGLDTTSRDFRLGTAAGIVAGFGGGLRSAGDDLVNVVHYTDEAGVGAISASRTMGTKSLQPFVTIPSQIPAGSTSAQVEQLLEIAPGRGAFSITFQTTRSNLMTPFNGPVTSGGAVQYQLRNPVTINPRNFVRTPGGVLTP